MLPPSSSSINAQCTVYTNKLLIRNQAQPERQSVEMREVSLGVPRRHMRAISQGAAEARFAAIDGLKPQRKRGLTS
jgi:hypothetical protein